MGTWLCLQADLALASAQNTSRSHRGQQTTHSLDTQGFSLRDAFQSLTDRSKGTAVSARSACWQPSFASARRPDIECADDMGHAPPSSPEDSRSSSYSTSHSGSSCSGRSNSSSSDDDGSEASAEHAQGAASGSEVMLALFTTAVACNDFCITYQLLLLLMHSYFNQCCGGSVLSVD